VLQIRNDAQQKLFFEVIIPHSSAVWHKTRSAALNKRSHAGLAGSAVFSSRKMFFSNG